MNKITQKNHPKVSASNFREQESTPPTQLVPPQQDETAIAPTAVSSCCGRRLLQELEIDATIVLTSTRTMWVLLLEEIFLKCTSHEDTVFFLQRGTFSSNEELRELILENIVKCCRIFVVFFLQNYTLADVMCRLYCSSPHVLADNHSTYTYRGCRSSSLILVSSTSSYEDSPELY